MERLPGTPCVLASDCVDGVRARKDEKEQELMRQSSQINDQVMERAAAYIREGMTERQVADYLTAQYSDLGCEGLSFSPHCVLRGQRRRSPSHAQTTPCCGPGTASCWTSAGRRRGTART